MRRSAKGFTLVEVTIILLVLVILSGILLPTIERFIDLARYVKVKEDVGMIAAIIELWKVDNCSRWFRQYGNDPAPLNRLDMMVSGGNTPAVDYTITGYYPDGMWDQAIQGPNLSWFSVDTMDNQLVLGCPYGNLGNCYPRPTHPNDGSTCGFRGAYISGPVTGDPWGNRYMVNVTYLGPGVGRNMPDGENNSSSCLNHKDCDVFVLSAGADETVQTDFAFDGVRAIGDDVIALVSGGF